jgi:hypothetical protein
MSKSCEGFEDSTRRGVKERTRERLGGQAGGFREHWMQITFEHKHHLCYCRTSGPLNEREKICN